MKLFTTVFLSLFVGFSANAQSYKSIKKGRWVGFLELSSEDKLWFEMKMTPSGMVVLNGKEVVPMNEPYTENDSVHVFFSNFNSELVFKVKNKKTIDGRWVNHLKTNYSIPFRATLSKETIFPKMELVPAEDNLETNFGGKWKAVFSPEQSSFDAIGMFEQKGKSLTGTFLTETGDFRFLSGNVHHSSIYLSGFDGSHAFLFVGSAKRDGMIDGRYLSGNHYQTKWTAERNESFELRHPDSLTHLVGDPHDYSLEFKHFDNTPFVFPNENYKDKAVIIQILGTWCGNCMDETLYFKELYNKYHDKGLEMISVGYEFGNSFDDFVNHLQAYQQRFDIEHTIVVGGSARKSSAKEDFGFLSDFTSFPTSIFIDRTGRIVRIHTGFSGPSTGKYYEEYKEKTEKLVEQMLSE